MGCGISHFCHLKLNLQRSAMLWVKDKILNENLEFCVFIDLMEKILELLAWLRYSMFVLKKLIFNLDFFICRYSYEGLSEDMHTWFFLYDEKVTHS